MNLPLHRHFAPLLGALAGALVAGAVWAGVEAVAMLGAGVDALEAAGAASSAALVLATAFALPAALVGWLWHHERVGGALTARVETAGWAAAAHVTGGALGLFGLGYAVYFAAHLVTASFASTAVRAIALGGSAPLLAVTALAVYRAAHTVLARATARRAAHRPWRRRHTAVLTAATLTATAAWAASFFVLAPQVFHELAPLRFVPPALSFAGALGGAVLLRGRALRAALPLAGLVAACALTLAALQATGPRSNALAQAVEQRTAGTRLVAAGLRRLQRPSTPGFVARNTGSATCRPGVAPPAASAIGAVSDSAPDIIFVTVDAMRWDRTGLSNYERPTTPNLVEHARRAAVFDAAYTPATSTRQSFRSMFSGVYPSLVDAPPSTRWGLSFTDTQETLAGYLSAAGYKTIALVSDLGAFPAEHNALKGFEVVDETGHPYHKAHQYSANYKVDRIAAYLTDTADARPRFIWTHLREVHQPYLVGPDPIDFGRGPSNRFDAALHFVDGELDRLLRFASNPHQRQKTYVFLGADHGHAFREHGMTAHGSTVHQEQSRVPLVVWGPDVTPSRHARPVSMLDVMPTIFDLLDLPHTVAFCGASLATTLRTGAPPPERPVYLEQVPDATTDHFSVGFVRDPHALILNPATGVLELYDMHADPAQKRNLAAAHPDLVQRYLDELRRFHTHHGFDPTRYRLEQFQQP